MGCALGIATIRDTSRPLSGEGDRYGLHVTPTGPPGPYMIQRCAACDDHGSLSLCLFVVLLFCFDISWMPVAELLVRACFVLSEGHNREGTLTPRGPPGAPPSRQYLLCNVFHSVIYGPPLGE